MKHDRAQFPALYCSPRELAWIFVAVAVLMLALEAFNGQ